MNRCLSLALGLAFLAGTHGALAAPGLKDKEDRSDLKKFQGDWEVASWVQLGQPFQIPGKWSWSFKDDKYVLDQGFNLEDGTIKLEPGKKPATIDLAITSGNCKGNSQPGIYKFDGDDIILCLAWPGNTDRPTAFSSTKDNRWILVTLKRVKKDK